MGFTLIEMIATVAIVLVLSAFLFSGTKSAMEKAKAAQCVGKIKNIATAFNLYASENNGSYPQFANEAGAPLIGNPLDHFKTYLGTEAASAWHCPSDPGTGVNNPNPKLNKTTRSYGMNGNVGVGYIIAKQGSFSKASRTILVAENWTGFWANSINGALVDTVYDNLGRGGQAAIMHEGKNLANYAFMDGHVERLSWLQVSPKDKGGRGLFAVAEDGRDGL